LEVPEIDQESAHYLITQLCGGAISDRGSNERAVWPDSKSVCLHQNYRLLIGGRRPGSIFPRQTLEVAYTRGQTTVYSAIQIAMGRRRISQVCA